MPKKREDKSMTSPEKIYRFELDEVTDQEKQFYELYKKDVSKELTHERFNVITDDEALQAAKDYKKIQVLIKEQERLRQILISKANGKNCIIGDLRIEKKSRKGVVDYKSIPELFFVDVEKYRKESVEYFQIG